MYRYNKANMASRTDIFLAAHPVFMVQELDEYLALKRGSGAQPIPLRPAAPLHRHQFELHR
jgi:hypothetical protein